METKQFQGITLSRLGMGYMRLPSSKPGDPSAPIDWERAHELIDHALAQGINYFDTAYVYNGGDSERYGTMQASPQELLSGYKVFRAGEPGLQSGL